MAFEEHKFYCLNCGQQALPIRRNKGYLHKAFHRKKLYCWHCKEEVNHIEIRNPEEEEEFKKNFINGVYKDEATDSIHFVRSSRIGQELLGKEKSGK